MSFEELKKDYYHKIANDVPNGTSDMVLHLPVMEWYSSRCNYVTEFGVRCGHSTVALLAGKPKKLTSYDIEDCRGIVNHLKGIELPCLWEFHQKNTVSKDWVIEPTDMLFVDTAHTYNQVKQELAIHGPLVKKYIAFHDTKTCWVKDSSGPNPNEEGIGRAINEYIQANDFRIVYRTDSCHGLLIIERL